MNIVVPYSFFTVLSQMKKKHYYKQNAKNVFLIDDARKGLIQPPVTSVLIEFISIKTIITRYCTFELCKIIIINQLFKVHVILKYEDSVRHASRTCRL